MKKIMALPFLLLFIFQSIAFSFSTNEIIIKQGAANLQKDIEHVTGELFLTETKLVFESHGLNIQGGTTTINLENIANVEKGWSKLLGLIPAVPNALKVTMKDGQIYRFTCFWPSRWKNAVEGQIKAKL